MLFTAEASHVAMNRVFQIKVALIALGMLNALLVAARARCRARRHAGLRAAAGARIRLAAFASLLIWLSVAACGRLIAYF